MGVSPQAPLEVLINEEEARPRDASANYWPGFKVITFDGGQEDGHDLESPSMHHSRSALARRPLQLSTVTAASRRRRRQTSSTMLAQCPAAKLPGAVATRGVHRLGMPMYACAAFA